MQKYHDEPKQYKGYLKSALVLPAGHDPLGIEAGGVGVTQEPGAEPRSGLKTRPWPERCRTVPFCNLSGCGMLRGSNGIPRQSRGL